MRSDLRRVCRLGRWLGLTLQSILTVSPAWLETQAGMFTPRQPRLTYRHNSARSEDTKGGLPVSSS